jgi:hypothetical protein
LAVPLILKTLEETSLSTWFRESESVFAFYGILTVHVIALATLAGLNWFVDMRLLGVARDVPLNSLRRVFPIAWAAFWFNLFSGILLILGYPTKELTNPLFYVKMALIVTGLYMMQKIRTRISESSDDTSVASSMSGIAKTSIAVWLGVIVFGRLLAYTYTYLLYGVKPQH